MKLTHLKEKKPLIHCITNPISINQCANLILAVGCLPIMAEHPDEVQEITRSSSALMLNLGNITDARMKSILISADEAQKHNIPIVFDAVGIACSSLRRKFTYDFLNNNTPTVLKGNYSEIKALYSSAYTGKGVDADTLLDPYEISQIAAELSQKLSCIILASGKTDIITNGKKMFYASNGCPQLGAVTGTGCMLGATVACALSVSRDIHSVARACSFFGICGELSEAFGKNGSFMTRLMDNLSSLSDDDIDKYIKMEEKDIEEL